MTEYEIKEFLQQHKDWRVKLYSPKDFTVINLPLFDLVSAIVDIAIKTCKETNN